MHKKIIIGMLCVLLVPVLCYAQVARNPAANYEGKTNFGSIGLTGLDVTGNPGYIEMNGCTSASCAQYYLWVDETGDLKIASSVTLSVFSSFPTGNWQNENFGDGTVVGAQS